MEATDKENKSNPKLLFIHQNRSLHSIINSLSAKQSNLHSSAVFPIIILIIVHEVLQHNNSHFNSIIKSCYFYKWLKTQF